MPIVTDSKSCTSKVEAAARIQVGEGTVSTCQGIPHAGVRSLLARSTVGWPEEVETDLFSGLR
jgi:hypothetical protein